MKEGVQKANSKIWNQIYDSPVLQSRLQQQSTLKCYVSRMRLSSIELGDKEICMQLGARQEHALEPAETANGELQAFPAA